MKDQDSHDTLSLRYMGGGFVRAGVVEEPEVEGSNPGCELGAHGGDSGGSPSTTQEPSEDGDRKEAEGL